MDGGSLEKLETLRLEIHSGGLGCWISGLRLQATLNIEIPPPSPTASQLVMVLIFCYFSRHYDFESVL